MDERKKVILLVEDEKQQREVLAKTLKEAGFGVLQAENGQAGLSMALDHQPDVILLDIRMPEMTGYEMLKKLRASNSWGAQVSVIFLTNISMTDESENLDIEGTLPAYYLVKSDTSMETIVEKIRQIVS